MIPKYFTLKEKINDDIISDIYPLGSNLPTEIQLAQKYHVSRSTVRQALDLLVADGIIEKKWGSGNSVIAKSNSLKRNTIMIIIPDKSKYGWDLAIDEMTSLFLKEGYTLEIKISKGQLSAEREYLAMLTQDLYGGLILSPAISYFPSTNTDLIQLLLKRQLPIIFVGAKPDGLYNVSNISYNSYDKGYQMARRSINSGHKSLGGIFLYDDTASMETFSGYTDAIRDANLPILDNCFLFCNSFDKPGVTSRSSGAINRFLKNAYLNATVIYLDDPTISTDGSYPVTTCDLRPTKSIGKEIAKQFLSQKKNGNSKTITIPYK